VSSHQGTDVVVTAEQAGVTVASAPSVAAQFGRILVPSQIEEAVTATLQKWFPTYLAEIARQMNVNRNIFPQPQNYTSRNSFDAESGEKLPKVVVVAPGLQDPPTRVGGGLYTARWRLGVGVAAAGKDEQSSNLRVKAYGAAARTILPQQQADVDAALGGGIVQIMWINETYDDLPQIANQHQLFKAASLWFFVDVENVMSHWKGPEAPLVDAPPDYTEVQDVIIDVQQMG